MSDKICNLCGKFINKEYIHYKNFIQGSDANLNICKKCLIKDDQKDQCDLCKNYYYRESMMQLFAMGVYLDETSEGNFKGGLNVCIKCYKEIKTEKEPNEL